MTADGDLIEQDLLALAEQGIELRHALYARFFAAFPDRRPAFLCPETTSVRMTDETLQILHGLATDEAWVWPLIAELVGTHRMYGTLPLAEYDAFIDMTLATLAEALGPDRNAENAAAWARQAARFKAQIAEANADWDRIIPKGLRA